MKISYKVSYILVLLLFIICLCGSVATILIIFKTIPIEEIIKYLQIFGILIGLIAFVMFMVYAPEILRKLKDLGWEKNPIIKGNGPFHKETDIKQ